MEREKGVGFGERPATGTTGSPGSVRSMKSRPPSASRAVRRVDPAASNTTPCVPQRNARPGQGRWLSSPGLRASLSAPSGVCGRRKWACRLAVEGCAQLGAASVFRRNGPAPKNMATPVGLACAARLAARCPPRALALEHPSAASSKNSSATRPRDVCPLPTALRALLSHRQQSAAAGLRAPAAWQTPAVLVCLLACWSHAGTLRLWPVARRALRVERLSARDGGPLHRGGETTPASHGHRRSTAWPPGCLLHAQHADARTIPHPEP